MVYLSQFSEAEVFTGSHEPKDFCGGLSSHLDPSPPSMAPIVDALAPDDLYYTYYFL